MGAVQTKKRRENREVRKEQGTEEKIKGDAV